MEWLVLLQEKDVLFTKSSRHWDATGTGVCDNLYSLALHNEWALISSENTSNELLHKRVGHLSKGGMVRLKDINDGFTFNGNLSDCTSCIKGEMHRQPFPKGKG